MRVIKIIVSELSESCRECLLSRLAPRKSGLFDLRCSVTQKYTKTKKIPSWCPLVVEDECEWKRTMMFYETFFGNPHYAERKDFSVVPTIIQRDYYKFCPICGKCIKYVESEE